MERPFHQRLIWLLPAIPVLMTLAHLMFAGETLLHSDSALKSVLAALAIEQGRLVPQGWTFANGDLLLNTPYLILIPIQLIGGLGVTTNLMATVVSYLLLVASAAWLAVRVQRISGLFTTSSSMATAVVASSIGAGMLEFTVTQGAYSFFTAQALLLSGLALIPGTRRYFLLVLAMSFLITLSNPVRGIVLIVLPLCLALLFHYAWQQRRWAAPTAPWMMIGFLLGGAAIGTLAYYWFLIPNVTNFDAAARISAPSAESALSALTGLAVGAFQFMELADWAELSPLGRVAQCLGWLVFIGGLVAPGFALITRSTRPEVRALAWAAYGTLSAGLLPLVLTQGLYQGFQEWRYASVGLTLGWVVLAFVVQTLPFRAARVSAAAAVFVAALATSAHWPFLAASRIVDAQGLSNDVRLSLISDLKARGVGVVGTSYWNSHVLTVLSSGGVSGLPIAYNQRIAPFPHHMPHLVRQGDYGPRHALALTFSEWQSLGEEGAQWQFGNPLETFTSGPFLVKVYDRAVLKDALDSTVRFDAPVDPASLGIAIVPGEILDCPQACVLTLRVTNTGITTLSSNGHYPLRIGLIGSDKQGRIVDYSDIRLEFPDALTPGEVQTISRRIEGLNPEYSYRPCLMQENIAWLCGTTSLGTAIDAPIPPEQIATRLELAQAPRYNAAGDSLELTVRIHNDGQATLVGQGLAMVNLGAMLLGPEGPDAPPGLRDFVRAPLPLLAPGTQAEVAISLPAGPLLGLPVRLELVQEGVNWFANYGQPVLDLGPFQRCQGAAGTLCGADGQALSP